jgi:hypothetical protein
MRIITSGTTSNILDDLFIQDATASNGAGLSTLAYNTSGLTCYYKRSNGTASVAVTLASITTLGTFVSGGFKAVDATNMPGVYEFHPPDASMATGAKSVTFYFQGAANMAPAVLVFALSAFDLQTAKQAVSLASADVTGNLPSNTVQVAGQTASAAAAVTFPASIGTSTYAGIDTSGTTTLLSRIPQAFQYDSNNLPKVDVEDWHASAVTTAVPNTASVTVTTNSDKSGYSLASAPPTAAAIATAVWQDLLAGADFGTNSSIGKLLATYTTPPTISQITTGVWTDTTSSDFSAAGSPGHAVLTNLDTNIGSRSTFAGGAVASVIAPVTVGSNSDKTGYSLAPTGLDSIAVTDPGAPALQTTLPKMLVALWRSVFRKHTFTATQSKMYADDGSTVNSTATVSDDGTTQTVGAAS